MLPQPTTHETLLARLADDGDTAAWHEFTYRYGELIRSVARRRGLQPADCDDVMQDVLLGLSQAMPGFQYDPSKGKFRSYLKTFVLRCVFRKFRQKRPAERQVGMEAVGSAAAADPQIDQIWEEEWRAHHLRQAMRWIEAEFGQMDRAAFTAYVVEQRDARATADALGISVDRVYQAKSRILRRLSEIIEQQVLEEG